MQSKIIALFLDHMEKFYIGLEIVLVQIVENVLNTGTHQTCELKKITPTSLPYSYTLLYATIVAQFQVAKQPLNDMSTAFRKLQVLPLDLANLIKIIELPTLTSAFSHRT